jgi:hypothetical protein
MPGPGRHPGMSLRSAMGDEQQPVGEGEGRAIGEHS